MSIEKDMALLRAIATFDMLGSEALHVLAAATSERTLAAGETLFEAGEAAEGAYVVVSGRIRLSDGTRPRAKRILREVGPGTLIGETALVVETPRPATAVAAEPAVVKLIPRATFLRVLERHPEAAVKLRRAIAKRLDDTIRALDSVRVKLEDQRQRRRR